MMSGKSRQDGVHRGDQIIVASGDCAVVRSALRDLDVQVTSEPAEIPQLGLVKLELPQLAADIRKTRADVYLTRYAESVLGSRRPAGTAPEEIADLDLLMFRLRFDFAYRYAGWTPEMGKNRIMKSTEALGWRGEIGGGGAIGQGEIGGGGVLPEGEIGGGGATRLDPADDTPLIDRHGPAGRGVRVCVMDTEIYQHKEFAELEHKSFTVPAPAGRSGPMAWHGTFGAGLILKRAPRAEIVSVPVLDAEGQAEVWEVARKIAEFADSDAESGGPITIVHLPWTAFVRDGEPPMVLAAAVRRLARPGRVIAAAAGNHRDSADPELPGNTAAYPAGLPEVTAVGGLGPNSEPAEFSPKPETAPWLDVARPAVGVRSTYRENGYARWSGTSFAAARFAGELAARTTGGGDPTPVAAELAGRWRAEYAKQYGR